MKIRFYVLQFCVALLYVLTFSYCYVAYLNVYWDYMGYDLFARTPAFLVTSVLIATLPSLSHRGARAVSSSLSVFIYSLLYVPIIMTFAFGSKRPPEQILILQLTFMASMCLLFLSDLLVFRSPLYLHTKFDLMQVVFGLTAAFTLYVLFVYRSNLRFVSTFDEAIYELRFANRDLGQSLLTRYGVAWLTSVWIPLCLAYGLTRRKLVPFLLGTGACVAIYMAIAAKSVILLPVIYALVWGLLSQGRLNRLFALFVGSLGAFAGLLTLVAKPGSLGFSAGSIVLARTIGNGGQITMMYDDFFATHAHTNFTHLNVVQALTHAYPYGNLGVGQVVGQYYYSLQMNANANFWATDGLAALGLIGIPVASMLCALLFVGVNSVTRGYNQMFVMLSFLPFMLMLLNTSLMSSIWSGGAFFLFLFFLFNRPPADISESQTQKLPATTPLPRPSSQI
ncbi:MAG: hypothetical protein ABIT91_08230 [Gemmatimonadaceae bacterium]